MPFTRSATLLSPLTVLLASACATQQPKIPGTNRPATLLSEMGLFDGPVAAQHPAPGLVPYEVNVPLFSDETVKHRFLRVPPGRTIAYSETGRWSLPVGAILVKTFAYPRDARDPSQGERLLETRLLVQESDGLHGYTFVWNDAQTDAVYTAGGAALDAAWTDASGNARQLRYRVPEQARCSSCHQHDGQVTPLGLRTAQMNRDHDYGGGSEDQLAHLEGLGLLAPPPSQSGPHARLTPPDADAPVEVRARSYLDANCSHCHSAGGLAERAADVRFEATNADERTLGICDRSHKALAGRTFEIVPGQPDQSVLVYRMESADPEIHMPLSTNGLTDPVGLALVRAWITELPARACTP